MQFWQTNVRMLYVYVYVWFIGSRETENKKPKRVIRCTCTLL